MLKIRLQRVGRKHEPSFRLVLTDSKNSTKSGKYLENLGSFDARRGEKAEFKTDRVVYWMSKGAQASGTVHNLLISKKIITGKKINVLPLKKAIVKDAPVEQAASVEEKAEAEVSADTAEAEVATPEAPTAPEEKPEEKTEEKAATEEPVEEVVA